MASDQATSSIQSHNKALHPLPEREAGDPEAGRTRPVEQEIRDQRSMQTQAKAYAVGK